MYALIKDTISGIHIVKSYNLRNPFIDKFKDISDHIFKNNLRILRINGLYTYRISTTIITVPQFLCIILGGYFAVRGEMSIGELIAYQSLVYYLTDPVMQIFQLVTDYKVVKASAVRVDGIIKLPMEEEENRIPYQKVEKAACINFEDVTFEYDKDHEILQKINITIPEGKTVAIVGASGSGKSSMLKLLFGFYTLKQGDIKIFGNSIKNVSLQDLHKQIAYMSQETFLFHVSVAENIGYGREGATLDDIMAAAKAADAHDFIMRLSNGYDTVLGDSGQKLSGGEQQRIGLARVLLSEAPILVFDEPTSSLDTMTEINIQNAMKNISDKKTVIIVAHRYSTMQNADEIIVLEDKRIVEKSTHLELMENNSVYSRLYKKQLKLEQ